MKINSMLSFRAKLYIDEPTINELKKNYGRNEAYNAYIDAGLYAQKFGSDKDIVKFIYRKPYENDSEEKDAKGVLSILAFKNENPVFISKICTEAGALINNMKVLIDKAFIDSDISNILDDISNKEKEQTEELFASLIEEDTTAKDIKCLIENGANPHLLDEDKMNSLHYSETAEQTEALLEYKVDPNVKDVFGMTPLHHAKTAEQTEALLKNGADVNAKDFSEMTPLHHAQTVKQMETLLKNDADPNAKDVYGMTPLHYAKNEKQAKVLLKYGADPSLKSKRDQTPLGIAIEDQKVDIVKLLW